MPLLVVSHSSVLSFFRYKMLLLEKDYLSSGTASRVAGSVSLWLVQKWVTVKVPPSVSPSAAGSPLKLEVDSMADVVWAARGSDVDDDEVAELAAACGSTPPPPLDRPTTPVLSTTSPPAATAGNARPAVTSPPQPRRHRRSKPQLEFEFRQDKPVTSLASIALALVSSLASCTRSHL
jgi:hypothetical protein